MQLKGIENIIFDLGGVIVNINPGLTIAELRNLNRSSNEIEELHNDKILTQFETGRVGEDEFLRWLGLKLNYADFEKLVNAWNRMVLYVSPNWINKLKQLGNCYRLFVLSNTNPIHFKKVKEVINEVILFDEFESLFNATYYSHLTGRCKPSQEVFQQVLDDNDLSAECTLFIDDMIENIHGAEKAGLKTFHFQPDLKPEDLFDNGRTAS